MSQVDIRVKLTEWPYSSGLEVGMLGTIISEHARYLMVKWDNLSRPIAMRYEEVFKI